MVTPRLLIGLVTGGTLAVLDTTVVVPILTLIGKDLGGGTSVAWLLAAYLVASTVTMPLWGRAFDMRGERQSYAAALALFTAGTILALAAPTLPMLIAARVVQGVGAGGLVPLGQAILAKRSTPEQRARLQIVYSATYGVAAAAGPVLGGWIADVASWRWAFAVVLPFVLLAGLLLFPLLRARQETELKPFDMIGTLLLTVGLVAVLVGVERLSTPGAFPGIAIAVGLLVLVLFGWYERRAAEPILPMSLLTTPLIAGCALTTLISGFILFAFLTYLPPLIAAADPSMNSGVVVVPVTIGVMTLGAVSGWLALRVGTRSLTLVAGAFAGCAGLVVVVTGGSVAGLIAASFLAGFGTGFSTMPGLLLAQRAAPADQLGAATSLIIYSRNFGGALGVAVVATITEGLASATVSTSQAQLRAFDLVTVIGFAMVAVALLLPRRKVERDIIAASGTVGGET